MSCPTEAADVSLSSRNTAAVLGVTYRQLDYATRNVRQLRNLPTMSGGSGSRRRYDLDTIRRLMIAADLADAMPHGEYNGGGSQWIRAAEATMAAGPPPPTGFAVLDGDGEVTYHEMIDPSDFALGPIGTVVRFDLKTLATVAEAVRAARAA